MIRYRKVPKVEWQLKVKEIQNTYFMILNNDFKFFCILIKLSALFFVLRLISTSPYTNCSINFDLPAAFFMFTKSIEKLNFDALRRFSRTTRQSQIFSILAKQSWLLFERNSFVCVLMHILQLIATSTSVACDLWSKTFINNILPSLKTAAFDLLKFCRI